jgi:hypothetical protein
MLASPPPGIGRKESRDTWDAGQRRQETSSEAAVQGHPEWKQMACRHDLEFECSLPILKNQCWLARQDQAEESKFWRGGNCGMYSWLDEH